MAAQEINKDFGTYLSQNTLKSGIVTGHVCHSGKEILKYNEILICLSGCQQADQVP